MKARLKAKIKKKLEPIKNEEQSEVIQDGLTVADKTSKEIVLLKNKLDFIFKDFDSSFNSPGKKFLIKLAKDEKKIDYNNLFFEIDNKSFVTSADFLKEIGTLYDLLIYLLENSINAVTSAQTQLYFLKAITVLKTIISNIKTDIADQSEEQKKKTFAKQKNVLSNAEMWLKKRGELIEQFTKVNIISKDEMNFMMLLKKSEESISKKSEQKSDQSIPNGCKCQNIDLIL